VCTITAAPDEEAVGRKAPKGVFRQERSERGLEGRVINRFSIIRGSSGEDRRTGAGVCEGLEEVTLVQQVVERVSTAKVCRAINFFTEQILNAIVHGD